MTALPLRILGIDPGLNITGYGVLEVVAGRLKLCEAISNFYEMTLTCDPNAVNALSLNVSGQD